jgi:DNA-binding LacI/PurR family transcriptional regulator
MISLKELAKISGVNVSTVSRALNNSNRVKLETKEQIKKLAIEYNYIPDDRARGLVGKNTFTVGIIIPEFINTFYAEIIEGLDSVLKKAGYTMLFGKSGFSFRNEMDYLKIFQSKRVEGIIACSVSQEFLNQARKIAKNIPLVLADTFTIDRDFDSVSIDNVFGVESVVEYLLKSGHKKIGFISDTIVSSVRLEAYKRALTMHDIPVKDEYIQVGVDRYEYGGYLLMKEIICLKDRPTAVFAVTDNMAIGAIHAVKDAGLNVPNDISLVGFDDIMVSSYMDTPLTTVLQPKYEIGKTSAELLLQRIKGIEIGITKQVVLKPQLIVRQTTKSTLKNDL